LAALRLHPVVDVERATDRELVRAGATGTSEAFAELYRRHSAAAVRVARGVLANGDDAADAVAEAFTKVFGNISGGRLSDDIEFRPYLLATTRNAAVDQVRRAGRLAPTPDVTELDPASAVRTEWSGSPRRGPSETIVASEESELVARAFRDLPQRWQSVLWLTEVEGVPPREAAQVLGLSANNVSQLATRARARLRERFLQAHVRNHAGPGCQTTVDRLGAYLAGTLSPAARRSVDEHLAGCDPCRARLAEVEDLGGALRRAVIPLPVLAAVAERLAGGHAGKRRLRRREPVGEQGSPATAVGGGPAGVSASGNVVVAKAAPVVQTAATSPVVTMAPVVAAEPGARLLARTAAGVVGFLVAVLPGSDGAGTTPKPAAAVPPPPAVTSTLAPPTTVPPPPDTASVPSPPVEAAASPAESPPPEPGPLPTTNHPRSTVAHARGSTVAVYDEPVGPGEGVPVLRLEHPLPSGAERVFLVTRTWEDWYEVLLPVRPNGSRGWVHSSDVSISNHEFSIVIELGVHRITVFRGEDVLLTERIGVGTANTPTPGGLYFTKELVDIVDEAGRDYPGGPYGPFAYGLSGFSDVLDSFGGGDGTLGIHGTNDPSSLGRDVSHGCIRMSNAGITALAETLPLGVPVEVRP
jgi:RNA polymerase sigma factor (sigma-70 family)